MRLLDVGASFGVFSLVACLRFDGSALAVEPAVEAAKMCRRLATVNNLGTNRLQVFEVAAGANEGVTVMDATTPDFLCLPSSTSDGQARRNVTVPVRTLDLLVKENRFMPTHVKVDVEGGELDVLAGAAGLLRCSGIVWHLEVHDAFLGLRGRSADEVYKLMGSVGFRLVWEKPERGVGGERFVTRTVWTRG
jgi:FkbM family methyltransferase